MLFRQLFDPVSSTFTYLLADEGTRAALLIDPVREQVERDLELIRDLGLRLEMVLETHIHADHVSAAGVLRSRTGARVVASELGAPCVDVRVRHGSRLSLGSIAIEVLATPGHTDDSISFLIGDRVFTGDALLIRGSGRSDFQNGDPEVLWDSLVNVLFQLPRETLVFPGHDYKGRTVSTIGEEVAFNPRVAGRTREQFVEIMRNLGLPPPAQLDVAVPMNRACGDGNPRVTAERS
ncbi:MAG TPA: MBL fold metallo-hydrolase [Polyangiaceae bacterium]|nr:MBL fold metallo-hydrolase [Polyangiaceae bacterium]